MACRPAIRMTRLTTIARTGRLTKRSVNFMMSSEGADAAFSSRDSHEAVLYLSSRALGLAVVGGFHRVVHLNGGSVAQPEHSGTHNFVSGVNSGGDGHLIASRALDFDHLLAHAAISVPLRVLHFGTTKTESP